jgi:hypothetical protein
MLLQDLFAPEQGKTYESVIAGNTASHSEASWWLKLLRMYLSFVQAADQ